MIQMFDQNLNLLESCFVLLRILHVMIGDIYKAGNLIRFKSQMGSM